VCDGLDVQSVNIGAVDTAGAIHVHVRVRMTAQRLNIRFLRFSCQTIDTAAAGKPLTLSCQTAPFVVCSHITSQRATAQLKLRSNGGGVTPSTLRSQIRQHFIATNKFSRILGDSDLSFLCDVAVQSAPRNGATTLQQHASGGMVVTGEAYWAWLDRVVALLTRFTTLFDNYALMMFVTRAQAVALLQQTDTANHAIALLDNTPDADSLSGSEPRLALAFVSDLGEPGQVEYKIVDKSVNGSNALLRVLARFGVTHMLLSNGASLPLFGLNSQQDASLGMTNATVAAAAAAAGASFVSVTSEHSSRRSSVSGPSSRRSSTRSRRRTASTGNAARKQQHQHQQQHQQQQHISATISAAQNSRKNSTASSSTSSSGDAPTSAAASRANSRRQVATARSSAAATATAAATQLRQQALDAINHVNPNLHATAANNNNAHRSVALASATPSALNPLVIESQPDTAVRSERCKHTYVLSVATARVNNIVAWLVDLNGARVPHGAQIVSTVIEQRNRAGVVRVVLAVRLKAQRLSIRCLALQCNVSDQEEPLTASPGNDPDSRDIVIVSEPFIVCSHITSQRAIAEETLRNAFNRPGGIVLPVVAPDVLTPHVGVDFSDVVSSQQSDMVPDAPRALSLTGVAGVALKRSSTGAAATAAKKSKRKRTAHSQPSARAAKQSNSGTQARRRAQSHAPARSAAAAATAANGRATSGGRARGAARKARTKSTPAAAGTQASDVLGARRRAVSAASAMPASKRARNAHHHDSTPLSSPIDDAVTSSDLDESQSIARVLSGAFSTSATSSRGLSSRSVSRPVSWFVGLEQPPRTATKLPPESLSLVAAAAAVVKPLVAAATATAPATHVEATPKLVDVAPVDSSKAPLDTAALRQSEFDVVNSLIAIPQIHDAVQRSVAANRTNSTI